MSFLWLCYKQQCGFRSPSFFLDSLPKRKANCPVVSRSLVTISSQRFIWVIQFSSVAQSCLTLWDPIESVMPPNHLILYCPLLLLSSTFPSITVYSNVTYSHQMAKVLEFHLQQQSFQWIFRTDSFRMDWLDLLALHGTQSLHYHSWKALILQCSAFFIAQLSHPYMTTGKTIPLIARTFVGKIISVLFNMLSRLVKLFFQGINVFKLHGCSHHLQWFWNPKK